MNDCVIVQFNCRSIYTKLAELKIFLYTKKPNIVCLCETWTVATKLPKFIDYTAVWKHRDGRGGGLCILVRSSIIVIPSTLNMYAPSSIEIQRCTVKFRNFELDILNVYNPNNNVTTREFEYYINQLGRYKLIIGDFNGHHRLWSYVNSGSNATGNSLSEILTRNDNLCLITPPRLPTFFNSRTGTSSTLDLCFVSTNINLGSSVEVGPCLSSDHNPVIIKICHSPKTVALKFRPKWKFNNVKWDDWRDGLASVEFEGDENVEEMDRKISETLLGSNYIIPKTAGVYKPKFNRPWWNVECSRLVALRRHAKHIFRRHPTEVNQRSWRQAENNAKRHIAKSKKESWEEFTSTLNCFTPTNTIWNTLKKIKGTFDPTITVLDCNNIFITDPKDKAEEFANYFQSVFSIPFPSEMENNRMYFIIQAAIMNDERKEYNSMLTMEELKIAVANLKDTSPGLDEIHNNFIKNASFNTLEAILDMFNKSWMEEYVPKCWKIALLVPILKPGKPSATVGSYRPISMLSSIGKLIERIICNRLQFELEKGNLLSETQFGFRKVRSTNDTLTILEHTIRETLIKKQICIVVFIDLAGAFDRVWKMAVLFKLQKMGFRGRILGWLFSYLTDRKFKVIVEGETSNERQITSSVPQGAVLSPTLFNILLSDLAKIPEVNYSEFADDLALYYSGNDVQLVVNKVQEALSAVNDWANTWGQKLNINKTKAMYFTNKRTYPNTIKLNGNEIEYIAKHKFLGLIFDSPRLTWKDQINNLKSKCTPAISIMKSIAGQHWGADREVLLSYYKSVVRSKLDYASHLYDGSASTNLDSLNMIQNQCLRIALGGEEHNTCPLPTCRGKYISPVHQETVFIN